MKTKILIPIILLAMVVVSPVAEACTFEFETETKTVKAGETFDLTVTVVYKHRRCTIEITDTEFEVTNAEITEQSEWKEEKRGHFSKTLTLKATATGEAGVEVIRECSREGRFSDTYSMKVE